MLNVAPRADHCTTLDRNVPLLGNAMTEAQANAALHDAAQRMEWEDLHAGAWMAPSTRSRPTQRTNTACDAVLLVLLVLCVGALVMGVL
jgi:hypothetical protein